MTGQKVGHAYFGVGKVLSVDNNNFCAIVNFGYPYGVRVVSLLEIQPITIDWPAFGIA